VEETGDVVSGIGSAMSGITTAEASIL
jgi:hypothetical protein